MKYVIKKLNKISTKWVAFCGWSGITLLYLVQAILNNRLALDGIKLAKTEETKQELLIENKVLENEIAYKSSLKYIEPLAKKMGFKKTEVRWLP